MFRNFIVLVTIVAALSNFAVAETNHPPAKTVSSTPATSSSEPAAAPATIGVAPAELRAILDQVQAVIHTQTEQLESQRLQIERQQSELEELRREVTASKPLQASSADQEQSAASTVALLSSAARGLVASSSPSGPTVPVPIAAQAAEKGNGTESSGAPLSFHFGQGSLTPGGWVDFTAIYRTADVGSGLGTSFGSIPYNNTVAGGLSETRFTAQGSRVTLRADEVFGATKVFGYGEADFNGYLPSNAYVSTNSDTLRLRVYFTDVSRGRWELLGGQSWSLLTPNRVGVSPFLSEIYNTLHLDTNYQAGLVYARQAQIRGVYHFTNNIALGLSAENPEQFSGGAATFPALFSTSETDLGSSTGSGGGTATPTLHPDIIAKLSADAHWGDRRWHFESAGLLTPVEILTPASVTKTTSTKDIREGAAISSVANLEIARGFHLIVTGFWSDGGGRYIGGLGPAFVVSQSGTKTSPFQAQLVHSGSGIASAEWQANKTNLLSVSYSGAYFDRVFSTDPSTGTLVGYGFQGSANSNNRAIQEGTFSSATTLWKRQAYGSVQFIMQSSYITRAPWYIAPGAPKDAHIYSGYANLRYILP